jgi:hypothetical protein
MSFEMSIPSDWVEGNRCICLSRNALSFLDNAGRQCVASGTQCRNGLVVLSEVSCASLSQTELEWFASRKYLRAVYDEDGALAEVVFSERGRSFASYLATCVSVCSIPDMLLERPSEWAQLCAADGASPFWDSQSYDLWLGPALVKHFRRRANHQMMILDHFQQHGWPSAISDPLPLDEQESINPKRRLNLTLKNMNRSLNTDLMKFCGDGTGMGILWKTIP